MRGVFVVSLDFELHWGICSTLRVKDYHENLNGTREAIDQILETFMKYKIHATWGTVGFLFCRNKKEIEFFSPSSLPEFRNSQYSSYDYFSEVGESEEDDPYHFASHVIEKISKYDYQEIASHTWSHLFFLERGITNSDIDNDIASAIKIGKETGYTLNSIIFPRNQFKEGIRDILKKHGIKYYRGNIDAYLLKARKSGEHNNLIRALRLLDSYINITGYNTFSVNDDDEIINIPGSRFLRPYNPSLSFFEKLRLKRICGEMTHAAQNGLTYHLWWHPHNFGTYTAENIKFLKKILDHFTFLQSKYGMISRSMNEF